MRKLYRQICAVWQTLWQREDGANLVFVALSMTVLLGFAGLAIDGSYAYYQNQRMQIAADAAVLGGARLLALGNSTEYARSEAQALAEVNGANVPPQIQFLNENTEIQVVASHTFTTFFASIVGYDTMTVSASARANFVQVVRESAGNLLPITAPCDDVATYTIGQIVEFRDSKTGPGNFGWITWNGSTSATTLAENIIDPSRSGEREIGKWIQGATGNMNKRQVRDALDKLIKQETVVTIPLYDGTRGRGSHFDYHVCGFAQFVLVNRAGTTLQGKFVRTVARGEIPIGNVPTFGVYDIRITQ